jgi:type IV pilus assembly protein PilN
MKMRIPVNIASDPFRNYRPMLAIAAVLGIAMTLLLGLLFYVARGERAAAADTRRRVEDLQRDLDKLKRAQSETQVYLNQPGNAEVFERSIFLNTILQRKGVSWTRLFADLEKVMPGSVRLISIRPEVGEKEVLLDMQVGASSVEAAYRFLMQLEASPQFGPTTIRNMLPPTQNEPLYRYRINVNYVQKL